MDRPATYLNHRSSLRARVVSGLLGASLALGAILPCVSVTPAAARAADAQVVTGPASIMDVTAELRRHHLREYRLDVGGSWPADRDRYLRDHREREYRR